MGYSTWFSAPAMISTARDPRYTVIWKSTKLVNFLILAVSWAIAHCFFFGSGDDLTARYPRYTVIWKSTKLMNFLILTVSWAIAHGFLAPGMILKARDARYTVIWKSTKLMNFVIFLPFSWAIAHGFRLRGRFQRPVTPGMR